MQILGTNGSSGGDIHTAVTAASLAMTSFGIPLTGILINISSLCCLSKQIFDYI
jgi:ribonuclease PH